MNTPKPLASFVAMGFSRGEQFVELVSNDPTANGGAGDLTFFLLRFNQGCNVTPTGCSNDDVLTPKVEGSFTGYSLYQDTNIKNTIFDCLQCHQTGGPPPYHESRVTDPTKLAAATTAYKSAMAGTPLTMDIREVFLDSALQDMTFRPAADLVTAGDGAGIMIQIYQQCHNSSLDQASSRAKFDVTKLSTMSREEKDKAILRLTLETTAFRRMPAPRFRALSPDEINLVTQELMK